MAEIRLAPSHSWIVWHCEFDV